jgi:hypothetical protein
VEAISVAPVILANERLEILSLMMHFPSRLIFRI